MSFDLHFYFAGPNRPSSFDLLFAWSDEHRFFRRASANGGVQLSYENPDTGVYFSLAQSNPPPPNPLTFALAPAYLAFNLNFMRPRFFALESMELVVDLFKRLDLVAYDPQAGQVGRPTAAMLVDVWCRGNQAAVGAMRALGRAQMPWMHPDAADAFWRYCKGYGARKSALREVFVPQLAAMRRGDVAVRVAILLEPTSYVVPPADLFFVKRNGAMHLVRAEHVHAALGHLYRPLDDAPEFRSIPQNVLFDPGVMDAWDRFYRTAPLEGPLASLQSLSADAFVDC